MNWSADLGLDSMRVRASAHGHYPVLHAVPNGRRDRFAPYKGRRVCKSRSGRWRPKHTFMAGKCLWCDRSDLNHRLVVES